MNIKYLGHSAFELDTKEGKVLIDPFFTETPNINFSQITDIFVTHGHSDHLGQAIEISRQTGAKITAIFELANYCSSKGAITNGIGLGSWIDFKWGKSIAVPAFHSSSLPNGMYAGCPCGFIFKIKDKTIYHAGDTNLNSEMKIIGELYSPEISMLPIGGHYTMDIEHAIIASQWLNSNDIIPMHYNTFDAIRVDINNFKTLIQNADKNPIIMKINETINV